MRLLVNPATHNALNGTTRNTVSTNGCSQPKADRENMKSAIRILRTAALCFALTHAVQAPAASANAELVTALERADLSAVNKALRMGASLAGPLPYPSDPSIRRSPIQWLLRYDPSDDPPEQVEAKRLEVLKLLHAKGAKLSGHQDEMFATIVHGHEKVLRLLLDMGASPSDRIYGYTPVELAYREGRPNLQKLLLSRGGPAISERSRLQIDLIHAVNERDPDAIRDALLAGGDINSADPSGETPLTALLSLPLLSRNPERTESNIALLAKFISEWKANPAKASEGEKATPPIILWISMNSFKEESFQLSADILEQLILRGADVRATNVFKETALHVAAERGNVPACKVLLSAGASPTATDFQNRTPMSVAKNAATRALLRAHQ